MEQGTPEWLTWRRTRVGASDAAAILGISPYKTAFELYLEKTGQKESNFNPAMSYGHKMEPIIRAYYEERVGEWFPAKTISHPDNDWMVASLDGISADNSRILEIKTCNAEVFKEAQCGRVPKYYYCQVQHQMACEPAASDAEMVFYRKGEYAYVIVDRNVHFIDQMMDQELEFYENCIVKGLPPPMSEKDSIDRTEDMEWMCLAAEGRMFYPEYLEKKAEWEAISKRWDNLKARFADATDDGNCHGGGASFTRSWRKGSVDTAKMKADGIDIDKYRKSASSSIRLTINLED